MTEPYLIAHVVRGQPAFDIAIKLQIGDEEGWIIPTSGYRAYPYWSESLYCINIEMLPDGNTMITTPAGQHLVPYPPEDWPDHYSINERTIYQAIEEDAALSREAAAPGTGIDISAVLGRLGIGQKPTIRRR